MLHPMEEGFADRYEVRVDLGRFDDFYPMMRWATAMTSFARASARSIVEASA